jgi:hypothetical protein
MELRTDTIGHFDNPTENNIRDAVIYSGEGGQEGDIVKLMIDDEHFLSIWVGQRSIGHRLTLRSGGWKLDSAEKLSSETVVDLMIKYLHGDSSTLNELQWIRPIDRVFLDNIMKFKNSKTTS